ncbi:MAG: histidinol-phosphate transaminase [Gammaproteobacteria bacterium]
MGPGSPVDLVRPVIRALDAYHVAPAAGAIKLDAMENPFPLPEELRRRLGEELAQAAINRYPDPVAPRLRAAVRAYLGLGPDVPMLLGNGSDELIQMIVSAVAAPDRVVLAPEPTFVMYSMLTRIAGMRFVGVPLREPDFALDVDATLAAIAEHRPAVVFIANPNNPTGNAFARTDLEQLIDATPGIVVVDEAYYPFARQTMVDLAGRHPRLVVMQTLSKLGLAGLRVGMAFGEAALIHELEKLRLPYNIGVLAQIAAAVVLEAPGVLDAQAAAIRAGREHLETELRRLPEFTVWPSRTNFILMRTAPGRARPIHAGLRERGVLIKLLDGSHPRLRDCLRVTVGTQAENAAFMAALHECG